MSLDIRQLCAVCAWRENCTKKHTIRESAMHCPDFTRDKTLPEEEVSKEAPTSAGMKKIVDPFA